MALATKCPHCNTLFRVAADQLKLRGGMVRCGSCHEVFDGNAALLDPDQILPQVMVPAAQALLPEPEADIVGTALPESNSIEETSAAQGTEPASESGAEQSGIEQSKIEEPGFVRQGRRHQRIGKALRILMPIGSLALAIALLLQGAMTFGNLLAAQVPQFEPALMSICAVIGCRIELPAQIDMIAIEQGELQSLGGNSFSYATLLHNQSTSAQAWPNIELTLNDANDKPVLRRVFAPNEYLSPPMDIGKGFPPHAEQAVKLHFKLVQIKASGYHIAVFYP